MLLILWPLVSLIFILLAGMANGVMDRISFHWFRAWPWMKSTPGRERFWRVVPAKDVDPEDLSSVKLTFYQKLKLNYEPPSLWTNKYKDGDPKKGEAFPLSSTVLVAFTDGWHLVKMFMKFFLVAAVIFYPGSGGLIFETLLIRMILDPCLLYLSWQFGFKLSYKYL